jgi:hypothetical protein
MPDTHSSSFNSTAASMLRQCAELLQSQQANPFRVNAYRRAAQTLETLDVDARAILREKGLDGLIDLPAIGRGIASAIEEIARTGRFSNLDRLRGTSDPEALFQSLPGIGPTLSRAIHDELHVDSLEGLEMAAYDGRLEAVPGIGRRRVEAIRAGLAKVLGDSRWRRRKPDSKPPIAILLAVDAEYRDKAAAQTLPRIAPRRFNPHAEPWLPILHTQTDGWHFTVLFSNTRMAHELDKTGDWVVEYFYDGDHQEGQHTIVTETKGKLRGRRVVRGREVECAEFYGGE